MKKILLILSCALILIGCKKNKEGFLLGEASATENKTALIILNEHVKNVQPFETSIIRGNVTYETDKDNLKASMDIMIQKDEKILINIRYLGFPVAKALIMPDSVQYYDVKGVYFDGDFSILSNLLGTDIDFNRFQNLLMGQVLDSSTNQNMEASLEEGLHKLINASEEDLQSSYYFEDKSALLKKEEISQKSTNRSVTISYPNYQKIGKYVVPTEINIKAEQEKSINLNLQYNKVTFDTDLNIHYKVPEGYKRINLK
ncbi:DUF4292 domain-containing protein [Myroides indicus]|nr:DUF4292 domain-containing protein [Myroides indicus]